MSLPKRVTGRSAIDLANRIEPENLILLDLNMKVWSGFRYPERATPGWCDGANYCLTVSGFRQRHLRADRRRRRRLSAPDSDPEVLLEAIRKGRR